MNELLEQLRIKLTERNAIDFLTDLVEHFDGNFGSFLIQRQIMNEHACRCAECDVELEEFPENID